MKRKEILRRLEERLARGEISETTYLEIKSRYDAEPEEPEEVAAPGSTIEEAVERIKENAARVAQDAVQAAGEALRAMDVSGMGARLSEEAIKLAGSNVISGNPVRTREFKAAGSTRVQGSLEAEIAKAAGSTVIEGDVRVEELRASGSTKIAGSLKAEQVETSGSLQVDKDVLVEEMIAGGSLRVGGNVTAEEFRAAGAVRIDGDLVAEEVDLELGGNSHIRSIRAEDVVVRSTGGFLRGRGELTVERVEGTDVRLESTTAAFVKGDDVRIGPHCRVDVVEAKDLVVHESSEVRERRTPAA
jgi:cytoskeletal protein CcmA (bactofilin family)